MTSPAGHVSPGPPTCLICRSSAIEHVLRVPDVPVHCNVQWATRAQALAAPRGDIDLVFCRVCGHLFNTAFDPGAVEYSGSYENSLHFSGRFKDYAESLTDRLIAAYGLRDKTLLEIGCGKGEFLTLLCEKGGNRGLGVDASYVPDGSDDARECPVVVLSEPFGEAHTGLAVDFVCCRHVLEHVPDPRAFLRQVRRVLGNRGGAVTYFEVPDVRFTLQGNGVWDLIYEHCSYFTPASLTAAFESVGCGVLALHEEYGGQYLGLEASADDGSGKTAGRRFSQEDIARLADDARAFRRRYEEHLAMERARLDDAAASGRRVAVWGGGSKGVTLLNVLRAAGEVDGVVDVNPRKQGRYVPGTGHRIVSPESLSHSRPDLVLVMNPIYEHEIRRALHDLGVGAAVVV